MTTKYKVEIGYCTDCEDKYHNWKPISGWIDKSDAITLGSTVKKDDNFMITGSWRIVARTIDEGSFFCEDTVVYTFDYYTRVVAPENYKKWIQESWNEYYEVAAKLSETTNPFEESRLSSRINYLKERIDFWGEKLKELEKTY